MAPTPDQVRSAVQRHCQHWNDRDQVAWESLFADDVTFDDPVGVPTKHGRDAVRAWITDLMVVRADVHAVLEWYVVKGRRVILSMQNRYYAPDPDGEHIDFAGLTVLEYAGEGLFGYEEDYWDTAGARTAYERFTAEVERCGGRGLEGGRLGRLQAERRAATEAVFARGG